MPKMYNPETQDVVDARGTDVQLNLNAGYVVVGNRPESEYLGKTRDEIHGDDAPNDRGAAKTVAEMEAELSVERERSSGRGSNRE